MDGNQDEDFDAIPHACSLFLLLVPSGLLGTLSQDASLSGYENHPESL
jgi:hypothetical protein